MQCPEKCSEFKKQRLLMNLLWIYLTIPPALWDSPPTLTFLLVYCRHAIHRYATGRSDPYSCCPWCCRDPSTCPAITQLCSPCVQPERRGQWLCFAHLPQHFCFGFAFVSHAEYYSFSLNFSKLRKILPSLYNDLRELHIYIIMFIDTYPGTYLVTVDKDEAILM